MESHLRLSALRGATAWVAMVRIGLKGRTMQQATKDAIRAARKSQNAASEAFMLNALAYKALGDVPQEDMPEYVEATNKIF